MECLLPIPSVLRTDGIGNIQPLIGPRTYLDYYLVISESANTREFSTAAGLEGKPAYCGCNFLTGLAGTFAVPEIGEAVRASR